MASRHPATPQAADATDDAAALIEAVLLVARTLGIVELWFIEPDPTDPLDHLVEGPHK